MHSPSSLFPALLLGTTIALIRPSSPAQALSANQVQQISVGITVLIDGMHPGSGVVVARSGATYYVLTARHVVKTEDEYTIVTATGDRYSVDYSRIKTLPGVDLALVPFTSQRTHSVATLANYAYDARFKNVFTAGWSVNRMRQFTAGVLGDRNFSLAMIQGLQREGYDLFYSNLTQVGMSGGPVLDTNGRVIGIHGLAEGEEVNDGQRGIARVKRGFSSGIPISTFLRLFPQVGVSLALRVETTLPSRLTSDQASTLQDFLNPSPLPNNASAVDWVNQGNQLYRVGRLQEALNAFNQAVQLNPKFHSAWYERGNVLFAMKRPVDALESYDRVIQLKPDLYGVWRDRGVLLAVLKHFMAALGSFDKAAELKPDDYVLWYMRGNLLNRDLQNYQAAIASYDRSLAINPNFADAWMGKGKALQALDQSTDALNAFDRAIQLNPSLSVAWILRSRTLAALDRKEEAIADLERALQFKPNDPEILQTLTTLKLGIGTFASP
jgi:tetratricopeptide (TPR) repeat protein